MSDIVERLRDYDAEDEARNVLPPCGLIAEAAAEIESLRSRLAELLAAAKKVTCERCGGSTCAPEHGRGIPAPGTCPDCDDLRRLLEEKP